MEAAHPEESELRTWVRIALLVVLILGKGWFAFAVVSDMGPPTWDYRPVQDLPSASPYGVYAPLPHSQHIRGAEGE